MGFMTIDGKQVEFTDEPNVLSVIRKADIDIPTLCYHSELSVYGACRLCTVENEKGKTFASCSEKPKDGMVVYTNTPRLMKYRKMILELLLAAHDRDCTTCIKSGECHLQELAHRMGVTTVPYKNRMTHHEIDASSPSIIRNPNKCILCGDCVRMCDNVQAVNAIDFTSRGTSATVAPAFNKLLNTTDCVGCGQCRVVCPTGAISINTNMDPVWEALADPDTKVIAQIAPAVRVAVGDAFDLPHQTPLVGGAASRNLEPIADIVNEPVATAPALRDDHSPAKRAAALMQPADTQHNDAAPASAEPSTTRVVQPSAVREETGERDNPDTGEIPVVQKPDGRLSADPNDPEVAKAIRDEHVEQKKATRAKHQRNRLAIVITILLAVAVLFGAGTGTYMWSQTRQSGYLPRRAY